MKLGCVPYINALPLTHFLDPKEFEIITRPPAQLLDLLQHDKVDAALLPIVNYFEVPDLYLIPHIAIASKGPVKSVKLFIHQKENPPTSPFDKGGLEGDLKQIKFIYLDNESRTSQLLLKTLLHYKYKMELSQITFLKDSEDPRNQANLLIGDKALTSPSPPPYKGGGTRGRSYDLGEEWWSFTQKPFVFAAWMTKNPNQKELSVQLKVARDKGLQKIDEVIKTLNPPNPPLLLPEADPPSEEKGGEGGILFLKQYFTKNIQYYMGEAELEGIQTFYEYLKPIEGYRDELNFRFVS